MAIYHFSAQMIKRSDGRSATAAAAYRAAENIADRTTGEVFDYTRKRGVFGSSILAPSYAPAWASNRVELWNRVEEVERRIDAQLAREIDVAIPNELADHDRIELIRSFVQEQFVDLGMIADVAFHDFESHNPHCHIMLTTRDITPDGFGPKKRTWNDRALLENWRKQWSVYANRALKKSGVAARIDHRSYEAQGIDLIPTKHLGPSAAGMERNGIETKVGSINRRIDKANARFMESQVELAVQRLEVTAEIERIRREALSQPSTFGTIEMGQACPEIAARVDQKSAKYRSGMAASLGDRYKAKLFLSTWKMDIDPALLKTLKWIDTESRALTLRSGEQVQDKGDSVSLSKGSDDAIRAAIAMARSKGWDSVRVRGSDDFQVRAALALQDAGIEPSLTSDIAKQRFNDDLEKRQTRFAEPVSKPEPSEPMPEPPSEPEPDLDALRARVRRATEPAPPQTNTFRDDTRKLKKWAHECWNALVVEGNPDGLADAFAETLEEQALMAGYSAFEIETVQRDGDWTRSKVGSKKQPSVPAHSPRRTGHSDPGNKPPGI